jgi:hypothetical protein
MARVLLSRDSLEYERRGRVVGEAHYREAIRARARELLRIGGRSSAGSGRPGGLARASPTSTASGGRTRSNETVLKVISWTKAQRAPLAQAKYAARTRERDPADASLTMSNEEGRTLSGSEVEAEIRSWELKADSENLSPAAERVAARERAAMTDRDRLQKRQAAHLIFSIPAHARADADRLERTVREALAETLGEGGFRYVYTIHTDHSSRPHAHIIVKAQSEPFRTASGATATRQLRLGPSELEAMRQVFTRHAQEQGSNVVATRREDREELRHEILAGRAPLRANKNLHQTTRHTRQGRTFEHHAPQWYAAHGFDYERRRLAAAGVGPAASASAEVAPEKHAGGLLGRLMSRLGVTRERETPDARSEAQNGASVERRAGGYFRNFENYRKGTEGTEARISAHFTATHRDPEGATESFRLMLREAPRLALWAANNHPIAFGEPTGDAGPGLQSSDLRAALRAGERREGRAGLAATKVDDPIFAGERIRVREATARARAGGRGERVTLAMARSIGRVAARLERQAAVEPGARERAAKIRELSRGEPRPAVREQESTGAPEGARRQSRDNEPNRGAPPPNKAERYKRLEDELKQRDGARMRRKTRDRDDGGRSR